MSVSSTFKSQDTEEWLDIYFTRPLGYLWARFFDKLGVHPNVVTILSILLGIAAAVCFYFEDLWVNIGGIFLLVWANLYDSADGQLARMTGKKTRWGRILDGFAGDVWFIKQLGDSIHHTKPWVKFGVSPFGIYRNAASWQQGSNTRGLQNYDDLYADVLKWVDNGWIDYCVPQLYWQIGHKAADYATLIRWWNVHAANRPLFIGEDVERTVKYADVDNPSTNQVAAKHRLHEECTNVGGTVLWYAKAAVDNYDRYGVFLRNYYWKYPALQPRMPFIDDKAPEKPRKLKAHKNDANVLLTWQAPKGSGWQDEAVKYVVYRFDAKEDIDLDDASHIVAVTPHPYLETAKPQAKGKYVYLVTALDRMSNEATAMWIPRFGKAGRYAVYVSYLSLANSIPDALYTVCEQAAAETKAKAVGKGVPRRRAAVMLDIYTEFSHQIKRNENVGLRDQVPGNIYGYIA